MNLRRFFSKLTKPTRKYKERLLACFPCELREDGRQAIEILPLERHEVTLIDGRIHRLDNLISEQDQSVILREEELTMPCRLYFDEPDIALEKSLTTTQATILNCIYLRHHNGHVRQRRLEQLANSYDYFVCPFRSQLIGEYVIEILEVLDSQINQKTLGDQVDFVRLNPFHWQQTQSRMVSYWDVYYRYRFPKLQDYIGKHLVDRINQAYQR